MGDMQPSGAFLLAATPESPMAHRESLVLVAVHGEEGSLGFFLNRPTDRGVVSALDRFGIETRGTGTPAFVPEPQIGRGGGVRPDVAWLLFDARASDELPEDSCLLTDSVGITASPEAVVQMLQQRTPLLFLFGHLTWEPGALDREIAGGQWLRTPVDPALVFEHPQSTRWTDAVCGTLGVSRPWLGAARFMHA